MNRNNSSCKQLVLAFALSALALTAAAQNDNIVYKDSNVRFTLVTDGTVRISLSRTVLRVKMHGSLCLPSNSLWYKKSKR